MAISWIVYSCLCCLQEYSVFCAQTHTCIHRWCHSFLINCTFSPLGFGTDWASVILLRCLSRITDAGVMSSISLTATGSKWQFLLWCFFLIQMKQWPLFFKISLHFLNIGDNSTLNRWVMLATVNTCRFLISVWSSHQCRGTGGPLPPDFLTGGSFWSSFVDVFLECVTAE